jgi:hypothetical protein
MQHERTDEPRPIYEAETELLLRAKISGQRFSENMTIVVHSGNRRNQYNKMCRAKQRGSVQYESAETSRVNA